MPRNQGDIDFGNHGVIVADDPGIHGLALGKPAKKVVANFFFDRF